MELNIAPINAESSGIISEDTFGIEDMGFILTLLREKIYSNIFRAICQEYCSNGRDSHREINKDYEPIHVFLPNTLSPFWKCRDFGQGISPDRMMKVFIKYGASTKRHNNKEGGGFGIGAKSSFGYSDTFHVNTYIDGIVRNYVAAIDESRCGKLALLYEGPTEERDGTEIVIPVRPEDFYKFRDETIQATKHWNPRPVVKGAHCDYPTIVRIVSGTNWYIDNNRTYGDSKINLIVDGIEYEYSGSEIDSYEDYGLYHGKLNLVFPVGAVSLTASREQVEIDEKTRKSVNDAYGIFKKELAEHCLSLIAAAPDFFTATRVCKETLGVFSSFRAKVDEFKQSLCFWNGEKLYPNGIKLNSYFMTYYAVSHEVSFINGVKTKKVVAKKDATNNSNELAINENYLYCLCEPGKSLTPTAARFMAEQFPGKTKIVFMTPTATQITDEVAILVKKLNTVNLQNYYNARKLAANKFSSMERLSVYKVSHNGNINRIKAAELLNDEAETKVFAFFEKDSYHNAKHLVKRNGNKISNNTFLNFNRYFENKISFYAFEVGKATERVSDSLKDLDILHVEDFVENFHKEKNISFFKFDFTEFMSKKGCYYYAINDTIGNAAFMTEMDNRAQQAGISTSNNFMSFMLHAKQMAECIQKQRKVEFLTEIVPREFKDGAEMARHYFDKMIEDYPMMKLNFELLMRKENWNTLFEYINLVDSSKETT